MVPGEESIRLDDENHKLTDKITNIQKLVRSLELRFEGHKWGSDGSTFTYTGNVLAGDVVIQKAIALLQPFCEEANLITYKTDKTFSKQKYRVRTVFNNTLLAEGVSLSQNYSVIMQAFDDTLENIGNIIINSRKLMQGNFSPQDNGIQDKKEF